MDVFDALNSNTMVDLAANSVVRVLPRLNEELNECWLTNKARYAYDGLFVQRLNASFLRVGLPFFFSSESVATFVEVFVRVDWGTASLALLNRIYAEQTSELKTIIGNTLDFYSTFAAKNFFNLLGSSNFSYTYEYLTNSVADFNHLYYFNVALSDLSNLPSFFLFLGTNLRFEAPLINFRINRLVQNTRTPVYKIGSSITLSPFSVTYLSSSLTSFLSISEFRHPFCKKLYNAYFSFNPFFIIGNAVMARVDFLVFVKAIEAFLANLRTYNVSGGLLYMFGITNQFTGFGFLSLYSSRVHVFDLGVLPSAKQVFKPLFSKRKEGCIAVYYSLGFDFTNSTVLDVDYLLAKKT